MRAPRFTKWRIVGMPTAPEAPAMRIVLISHTRR
jgi:hypothetical protein